MGASLTPSSGARLPNPEINVTPLVDVVLVLLIIFMVITPALADGEHIELPEILQVDKKAKEMNPIDVMLAPGGAVLLNKQPIDPGQLEAQLKTLYRETPDRGLLLMADTSLPYKRVRETFAMIQQIGFRGVSLKVIKKKAAGDA
jgi:biopolymer transport protein TolR